jgi:hypothetical protein
MLIDDMQNHTVITWILMMAVTPPAGGPYVYLDVPSAETPADGDNGIAQIGAPVVIWPAGIDDLDRTILFGDQVGPSR